MDADKMRELLRIKYGICSDEELLDSPGDKEWSGADYCLKRIKRDGEPSTAKYNLCFWPIAIFAGGREKRLQAMAHNQKHATIEVVGHIKGDVERFRH